MQVCEIRDALSARVLCGEEAMDREICTACGCDLMSDVLAFIKSKAILLTGLVNPHVVRTAEMLDIQAIAFVRGKTPPAEVLEMARERDIIIMNTDLTLYEACGVLYAKGLPGGVKAQ